MTADAVLFDLDGLLIDSEPVWYDVEYAVVTRLGGHWSPADQEACIGGTMDASARYMIEVAGARGSIPDICDELIEEMERRFRTDLPLHAGAVELVDAVRAAGVPTALVSSSYRRLIDAALDRLGHHRFDVTVAGDEVTHGKPDPEPYLTGCKRLGVDPRRTVVVEDAINGVRSAEAAGCVVAVVPSVAEIEPAPGRFVIRKLTEIDPGWLLDLIG